METERRYFMVELTNSDGSRAFQVYTVSSLAKPKSHSVMFIKEKFADQWPVFETVENCIIFWPEAKEVPEILKSRHRVVPCRDPRLEYCKFFRKHNIRDCPPNDPWDLVNGAMICRGAKIAETATVMPGAYIGAEVTVGEETYIGSGVRLVGRVRCGDRVIIRENAVIGADGRTTDKDDEGHYVSLPQFGGTYIGNDVEIGANTVIERGAIDDTVIGDGCKLDCMCLIGHNSTLGRDSLLVCGTTFLGSVNAGDRSYFGGQIIVRNQCSVGEGALVGMGSVVTKPVPEGAVVYGNPAKIHT